MSIRVLVVDDSMICREMLTELLQRQGDIQVVGRARNGKEAIELSRKLQPELITMDIQMPGMDGFTAIEEILALQPVPILVVTSSPVHHGEDRSFRALAAGALDLVRKPELEGPLAEQLRQKVRTLAGVRVVRRIRRRSDAFSPVAAGREKERSIVAIAASTGGPRVLLELLGDVSCHHPCSFLLTQHIPEGFCAGFAEWLNEELALDVSLARDGEGLRPGRLLVAPTGFHLSLRAGKVVRLSDDPPDDNHRPSASYMFRSLAASHGPQTVGIVLTGMGRDGALGLLELRRAGGLCIAQDEASSLVFGMPRAAVELQAAERVMDIAAMKQLLLRLQRTR